MIITFGKYKGKEITELPLEYLAWLKSPSIYDEKKKERVPFKVDEKIIEEATRVYKYKYIGENYNRLRLAGMEAMVTEYLIERLGDIAGLTIHDTLKEALIQLDKEYPMETVEKDDEWSSLKKGEKYRLTPDPEDDRILIWEILPSGHKKVVWHFSGWHWDAEEFNIEQGKLIGDIDSLYTLALKDY